MNLKHFKLEKTITMMKWNIFVILFIFLVCLSTCKSKRYPVCNVNFKSSNTTECFRSETTAFNITCDNGLINITDVFYIDLKRDCSGGVKCKACCHNLNGYNHIAGINAIDTCQSSSESFCSNTTEDRVHSYTIFYSCIPYPPTQSSTTVSKTTTKPTIKTTTTTTSTTTKSSKQTGSDKFPTVAVAAPVAIVVILAIGILTVICCVRRRKKNDGIYADNNQNNSNNLESVSNPAYINDELVNISKHSKSVERTELYFSRDSGYAECKDVDTVVDNNGEYNTINFTKSSPNIDPAYSHIKNQDKIDNTYSHIASDINDPNTASNYSHMHMKTRQPNNDVNHSTYNTLQPHAVNKPQKRLPVNDEESENEYNHANFSTESKQDDKDTKYSHLNSSNNGITKTSPTQANSSPHDVEYAEVVKNKNQRDLNADNDHAYFVLEKDDIRGAANDNNAHTYFVLEKDTANEKSNCINI